MQGALIETAVYSCEGLLPDLESPPIAARRALDQAGLRLSIEGWRSLPIEDRRKVTLAGVHEQIDGELVALLLRRAVPPPQRTMPVSDPDPTSPPEALIRALEPARGLDARRWSRLRAVDRYALSHAHRRAVARGTFNILGEVYDAVLAMSIPPPPPSPTPPSQRSTGYYSSVLPAPDEPDAARTPASPLATGRQTQPPPSVRHTNPSPGAGPRTSPPPAVSTHLTERGEVHMVDVAAKPTTKRRAVAQGSITMRAETIARLTSGDTPKGEVLATARIAAIMAAKRTPEIIPLCHAIALTGVEVVILVDDEASAVHVTVTTEAADRTGVEMEAMVGAGVGCLTIYDMLKGIDRDMVVTEVKLLEKSGGRTGHYVREEGR